MVTADVVIAAVMRARGHRSHGRARGSAAAVLPVAVVAATDCASHHERAVPVMRGGR